MLLCYPILIQFYLLFLIVIFKIIGFEISVSVLIVGWTNPCKFHSFCCSIVFLEIYIKFFMDNSFRNIIKNSSLKINDFIYIKSVEQ